MTNKNKKAFNLIIIITLIVMFFVILPNLSFAEGEVSVQTEETEETEVDAGADSDDGVMVIIQKIIGKWYYIFRYFSIAFMLVVLIFLGIRAAITSVAEEKAQFKRMLVDWVVGFVMIFGIHYFMAGVLALNDICLSGIESFNGNLADEFIKEMDSDFTGSSLYETVRTRAYEFSIGIGTSGMIMYMVLVYYTIRFILIYFKRFFTLLILTIMAPIAALSYAFTKINSGKAQILGKWAEEYVFNVFLQSIHALMYGTFVTMALALSDDSIAGFILAIVMLNFMLKAEKIFRKIFKISGKLLDDNADKDIKENLAAATALAATLKTTKNNEIVKDSTAAIRRGVGAVTNVGLYAGLSAYDKGLKFSENLDKNKEYQKVVKAKEDIKNAKTEKERDIAKAKLENLINSNSKLAAMEGRRNRLRRYKGQNESKTAVGALINKNNIDKRANALIAKEESEKGPLSDSRKKEIRKEVAQKYNDRIKRRTVEFNKYTNKYEVTSGIAKTLKSDFNSAVWGDNKTKQATKAMVNNTLKGITGAASMVASIPQMVANPVAGLALLAAGTKNAKLLYGKGQYNKLTTSKHRRVIRKSKRKNSKGKKDASKKYSFNRFNAKSLDTIKAQMRMDSASNMIFKINNPSLSVKMFTMPLRLTGIMGAARNIQSYSYEVNKAKKDRFERIETDFAIEKKNSYSRDFIGQYHNTVSDMEEDARTNLEGKTTEEILLMHKEETGTVFEVNDKKMQFKKNSISSLTQTNMIDNAILKVAIKNHVSDLKQLDLNNEFVKLEIIQELGNLGIIANVEDISLAENEKQINKLMEQIGERIDTIQKENPEALNEKLTQIVITEYMQKNGIENPDELKTEEHRNNIREEVLTRIEETEVLTSTEEIPKTEEEIIDDRVKNIVEEAMVVATTPEELKDIVQTRVTELFTEIYEKQESEEKESGTSSIEEELKRRKATYTSEKTTFTDIYSESSDSRTDNSQTEETVPEVVKGQTKVVIDKIENIVDKINEEKAEKEQRQEQQISFIEEIIDGVDIVEEEKTILTQNEAEVLSSESVIEEIKKQDARRTVRKSIEFKELNDTLRIIDEIRITPNNPEIQDDIIEDSSPKANDELLARLLLIKEQDQIALTLNVKEDSSEKKKFMTIDDQRSKITYNYTGIEEVIGLINNDKRKD